MVFIRKALFLITIIATFVCVRDVVAQTSTGLNGFENTTNHGTIGEVSSLYLKPNGFSFHPMVNDFLGRTDKLLTSSSNFGLQGYWQREGSQYNALALNVYWRAITPSFRSRDGEPTFEEPVGIYADWVEARLSYAATQETFLGGLKVQMGVGRGEIQDRGMKEIHKKFHTIMDQPSEHLTYEPMPTGETYAADTLIAYILPVLHMGSVRFNAQAAFGAQRDLIMQEYFAMFNTILAFSDHFKLGYERKVAHQYASDVYDRIRPIRYEDTYSLLLSKYFQPSVKFVSAYLSDDPVGQMYVDLLNVQIPF